MKTSTMLALVLALGGCAGATASSRARPAVPSVSPAELASARETVQRQRDRIRELEAALGLAQAQARQLADELRDREAAERARITRIGAERASEPQELAVEEETPRDSGPRPVLRLYGPATAPLPGPEAPPIVAAPPLPSIRLPVVVSPDGDPAAGVPAIPSAPVAIAPSPVPAPPPPTPVRPPADDPAVTEYRAALAHLSARRLDEALAGLDAFLRAHPRHAYADNALYWRGEIYYAQRDYRRALAELTALVERYPRGNKVPEALLRIGLCHERMGERARARAVFQRLRTQYPDSVAARMASREDV